MADVLTVDDIQGSTRRSWLKYLAVGAAGVGGGWWLFGDAETRPTAVSTFIDPNIDGIEWDGDTLLVELAGDTNGDEWAIIHEYHDDASDAIRSGTVPEFGGELRIDMASVIDSSRFPTPRFEFVLYTISSDDDGLSLDVERESGVAFELPEKEPRG